MIKGKLKAIIAIAGGFLFLLWLICLPDKFFGDVSYSTVVTAKNGELLGARVADDGQWRFPPGDSIPEKFVKSLIEYEDRGFYSHIGISLRGIFRAIIQNISNGRIISGGSTITMQTIRLHRRGDRNIFEKAIEMFMATRLELTYSKYEILRMYASHAPFGGNVVGIEAAMWRYLGKSGHDLSWAEAATLAVLQNAPSAIHLSKNRDKLNSKRNRLLKRLFEKGEITEEEYLLAIEEPLIGKPFPMPRFAPHLVEYINITDHGARVNTSIDMSLQKRVESLASHWRKELTLSGINDLSVIVADVKTGEIIAYCGNADINSDRDGQWVDIARSPRSSGSILKPLIYCASLQEGIILSETLLPDIPTDFGGFAPKNFDGGYSGVIEANKALAFSLNIPNVWLLKEFGVSRFATVLQQCGFTTLTRRADKYGLSLVLGGAEVSLIDVVNCYTKLARFERKCPLNDSVAVYSMLEAMREVNRPDQLDYSRVNSIQNIAWKTGTSYGARDGWAIGITPCFVVGVWVGNADGSGVADLTGARTAGPVMFEIFNLLPDSGWFKTPQGSKILVCSRSGHIAGKFCKDTVIQSVCENAIKSKTCPYCTLIPVSLDGRRRVIDMSEPMEMKSFFILPPMYSFFYKQSHADLEEPPVYIGEDEFLIKFIYPSEGAVISLPNKSDGSRSELICKVAHGDPSAKLFWHLDNNYIGNTSDLHMLRLTPDSGFQKLTVYDNYGRRKSLEFIIK